MGVKTNRT